mmetsp:Transcript_135002/g.431309  ORF Transcript_135002/g.431309 Transcript_135002/m.431309 type:complete len:203 (-) Transcript_135002:1873-2481(-)
MRRRRGAKSIATCRSRRVRRRWRRLGVRRTHDQALQLAGRWASGAARQNRPHLRELGGSGLGRSVRPHTLSRCYARGVAAEAHGEACGHHAQHRDPHRGGSDRARGEVQERLPLPRIRSGRPPCCRLRDRGCRCRLPRRRRPQHLRGAAAGAPRGVRVRHGLLHVRQRVSGSGGGSTHLLVQAHTHRRLGRPPWEWHPEYVR